MALQGLIFCRTGDEEAINGPAEKWDAEVVSSRKCLYFLKTWKAWDSHHVYHLSKPGHLQLLRRVMENQWDHVDLWNAVKGEPVMPGRRDEWVGSAWKTRSSCSTEQHLLEESDLTTRDPLWMILAGTYSIRLTSWWDGCWMGAWIHNTLWKNMTWLFPGHFPWLTLLGLWSFHAW